VQEKFVTHKVYPRIFAPTKAHKARDSALCEKIAKLGFLSPSHFDVQPKLASLESAWLVAGEELVKMNDFRAPKDKLVCIMNCCRIIGDVISTRQGNAGSADDFLPALFYVVLKSNPANLPSNVEYIAAYRGSQLLSSEQSYFLTQLASSVSFFSSANHASFNLDAEEFDALSAKMVGNQIASRPPPPGRALDLWTSSRFRFASVKEEELKVSDVAALLHEYKLLVGACAGLIEDRDKKQEETES